MEKQSAGEPDVEGLVRLRRDVDGGGVEAWVLPGRGASAERPGPAVIFAHGNGELIDHWPDVLSWYVRQGVTVLLPEYRGYGRSAGRPSERDITDDFVWFHDDLAGARYRGQTSSRPFDRRRGGSRRGIAAAGGPRGDVHGIRRIVRRYLVPAGQRPPNPRRSAGWTRRSSSSTARRLLVPFSHAENWSRSRRGHYGLPGVDHGCPPDWARSSEVERFCEEG